MMPPDPQKIEEWLSGMLDGALSEQEQRQLEIAMQNDPSIAAQLVQMADLRRSLLRGRPVGRLGAEFSKRVVQAARQRASQLDAPPAWILPDAPNARAPLGQEPVEDSEASEALWSEGYTKLQRPVPEALDIHPAGRRQKAMVRGLMGSVEEPEQHPESLRSRLVRVWMPSLGVVAALCVLFLALPRSGPSNLGQLGRGQTGQGQTGQGQTGLGQTGLGQPDSVVSMMPVEVAEEPTPEKTFVPDSSPLVQSQIPSVELPVADGSKLPVPPKTVAGAKYILVAEIEIDPQAEQNGMLSQLLEKYEIIFSSDAPLSKVDFDTLVASNVIKNPAADLALKTDAATTCYLVKSNPKRLDALLTDVANQYADFLSYRLNLSADPKVYAMMDHLADLKDSPNFAKRLVYQDSETGKELRSFESANQGAILDIESRKAPKPRKLADALSTKEDTFLILMVRTSK